MNPAPRQEPPVLPARVAHAYLQAHFPGIDLAGKDIRDPDLVLDGARRCLEGGRADHALHLLEMATDHRPEVEALWLKRLELRCFLGPEDAFIEAVRHFLEVHPDSERFGEVVTLWNRFAGT